MMDLNAESPRIAADSVAAQSATRRLVTGCHLPVSASDSTAIVAEAESGGNELMG
ncbi:hypothetical protein [Tuwongella immobilis]|uniref:Uncharacterized protein n=1 Tax=Tuwongella immobilis TaxID=692036 RepID=A0A6C2YM40_9BACT|nr:hypothetical protein [Tuwongella immobilis]VIP02193.1 unnamed protein product [Tuwongella immobilis]VTS00666.1 unnamed protein product [Tuwongella immobilis]